MNEPTTRSFAALDDVERIVQKAVRDAVTPLEQRLDAAERKLENTVTTEVAQKMIDSSVGGISDRVREVHSLFKAVDITMRNAETSVTRFGDKLVGTNALLDKLERRINEIDNRVDDIENESRGLRIALYGDASQKAGPPSLYGMIQSIPGELLIQFNQALLPVQAQLAAQDTLLKRHTEFIEKRRQIEQTVLGTVRAAVKSPLMVKLFWVAIAGGGIGTAAAILLQLLGQG